MSLHDEIIKGQLEQTMRIAAMTGQTDMLEKAIDASFEKGVAATIGEVRVWQGKKYRKEGAGQWIEIRPEGTGGMGQMSGVAKPHSVGKDTYKPILKPTEPKPAKEKDESTKLMSRDEYKKTLRSLFTPGENVGDARDLARNLAEDKQLVNRIIKDYPDIKYKRDLLDRIQWDIEAMMG